ncbi:hypothetical protein DV515_00015917 [Chloebia gouldiae]|uniref:Uncharacterized protein n=1 Tax=Chloebia gouldiae TaxID=44316 RepID=A0A3L8RUG3_CHLGU|nr:hypothetical protein DV515_00015917 [Chloebia gouldiae]
MQGRKAGPKLSPSDQKCPGWDLEKRRPRHRREDGEEDAGGDRPSLRSDFQECGRDSKASSSGVTLACETISTATSNLRAQPRSRSAVPRTPVSGSAVARGYRLCQEVRAGDGLG